MEHCQAVLESVFDLTRLYRIETIPLARIDNSYLSHDGNFFKFVARLGKYDLLMKGHFQQITLKDFYHYYPSKNAQNNISLGNTNKEIISAFKAAKYFLLYLTCL